MKRCSSVVASYAETVTLLDIMNVLTTLATVLSENLKNFFPAQSLDFYMNWLGCGIGIIYLKQENSNELIYHRLCGHMI